MTDDIELATDEELDEIRRELDQVRPSAGPFGGRFRRLIARIDAEKARAEAAEQSYENLRKASVHARNGKALQERVDQLDRDRHVLARWVMDYCVRGIGVESSAQLCAMAQALLGDYRDVLLEEEENDD